MKKVSVIVPVYNGEQHLSQCLDSICGQILKDIEIICVDDGSTDASWDILNRYKEQDDRIRLYRQKNLYAGAARNTGKSHATGEYLMFWDCDDFFEPDALERLYDRAKETDADVCVCGVSQYLQEKELLVPRLKQYLNKKRIPSEEPFNRTTNEDYILNFTNEAAWNKMFRREFIETLNLDFQPVRNGNDVYFTVNAMCLAERIATVNKALVNYRKNQSQSLVGTISKSPLTPFQAWVDAAEHLQKLGAFPEKSFTNKAVGSFAYLLRNLRQREAFMEAVTYLQQGALEKLHIKVREEGYYYSKWHNDFVKHLLTDTPEDFQSYLAFETYIQLTERSAEKNIQIKKVRALQKQEKKLMTQLQKKEKKLAEKDAELAKLRASWSFRIGKALVWLPGKIKRLAQATRRRLQS